jgi:hypothetical protein
MCIEDYTQCLIGGGIVVSFAQVKAKGVGFTEWCVLDLVNGHGNNSETDEGYPYFELVIGHISSLELFYNIWVYSNY